MATKKKMFKVSPKASAKKPDIIAYVSDYETLLCVPRKEKAMIKNWFGNGRNIKAYDRRAVIGVISIGSLNDFYSDGGN